MEHSFRTGVKELCFVWAATFWTTPSYRGVHAISGALAGKFGLYAGDAAGARV